MSISTENCEAEETSGLGCAYDAFQEYDEVTALISNLRNIFDDDKQCENAHDRFNYLLSLYQEQPHLIDPYLERILNQLLSFIRNTNTPEMLRNRAFQFMHLITKTRGPKVVVRHMPHEVGDLQLILNLISKQNSLNIETWQNSYMLLIWLSIVVMIPIDLNRLDGGISEKTGTSTPDRVMNIIKTYVMAKDKSSHAAPLLAGRFLTRPDAKVQQLPQFIDWCLTMLSTEHNFVDSVSIKQNVLTSLVQLFKIGKREDMLGYTSKVLQHLLQCKTTEDRNYTIRKLSLKVIQRIGLTFLKVKVAPWRYQRGSRTLVTNLNTVADIANRPAEAIISDEDMDDYDIPDEIEEIIEILLKGLQDENGLMRWSAAKGIGRITERLPQELANDVISSLVEIFNVKEGDEGWHGGCLALAEMGRRGLLLPVNLDTIVPLIMKGLIYDKLKGNCSVGSAVRDAACYVCWAFARAYNPDILKPYVQQIAEGLLITAVFDREVNCRRAAAAAFQENVGRQGTFPHGINILTTVDFFSVSLRSHSYLKLSVFVSQFKEYTIPLINHLNEYKINHWDVDVRNLASQALHNLTPKASQYMIKVVLPKLLPLTTGYDMNARHGAILSVAEIVMAVALLLRDQSLADFIGNSNMEGIRNVAFILCEKKAFRGLGEEMLRKAMCIFILKLCKSKLLSDGDWSLLETWKVIIFECLTKRDENLQNEASAAFSEMCFAYYVNDPLRYSSIVSTCLENLNSSKQETRCGFAKALGGLPNAILKSNFDEIILKLIEQTKLNEDKKAEETWTESRSAAINSLTSISQTVGIQAMSNQVVAELFSCFLEACNDYTTDRRGDIGSFVRMAALTGLKTFTKLVMSFNSALLNEKLVTQIFCICMRQAVEKIEKVREVANLTLLDLLHSKPEVPFIPHKRHLLEVFSAKNCQGVIWRNYDETFPIYVNFLNEKTYTNDLLLGFSMSVGSHIVYLMKYTQSCLIGYLTSIKSDKTKLTEIENSFLQLLNDNLHNKRTIEPLLMMADFLLNSGVFDQTDPDHFPLQLLELSWKAGGQSKTSTRVLAVTEVHSSLINFEGTCRTRALSYLTVLLCHHYPRVRNTAAQKMYEAIVGGVDIVPDESMEEVLTILSDTEWVEVKDKEEFKTLRKKVCQLIGIPPLLKPLRQTTTYLHLQ